MNSEEFTLKNLDDFEQLIQENKFNNSQQSNEIERLDHFSLSQHAIGESENFPVSNQPDENLNAESNSLLSVDNKVESCLIKYVAPIKQKAVVSANGDKNDFHMVKERKKKYDCDVCGKSFRQHYTLRRHLPTHTDERKFHCNACGKSFRQLSTLSQHRAIHSAARPYICELCNKTFNRTSTLISHKKTHTNNKPHQCEYCNKSFHQKGNLRNHVFTHTNARPYKCDQCDRGFNQKSNLMCHKLKAHHHFFYKYYCDFCGQMFLKRIDLKQHEQMKHSDSNWKGKAASELATYMKAEDLLANMSSAKSPFILFRPVSSMPVLIRLSLLQTNRIALVPATADDFLQFGQFTIQPKPLNESDDNYNSGLTVGVIVQMKVPVGATLVQSSETINNGSFQLDIFGTQHSKNSFIFTITDLVKNVDKSLTSALDEDVRLVFSDNMPKSQFGFSNDHQMIREGPSLNQRISDGCPYDPQVNKNTTFMEIFGKIQ